VLTKLRKYEDFHRAVNGVTRKLCKDCNEWYNMNTDNFSRSSKSKDGFGNICKKCYSIKQKEAYYRNRDKRLEYANNYYAEHKDEQSERFKNWYKDNRDYRIEYNKDYFKRESKRRKEYYYQYQQLNKERFREYSKMHQKHDITSAEWDACKKYFGYSCAYCGISEQGAKEKQGQYLHQEHVDPDGANDLSNCIPACRHCNCSKHTYTINEWYNKNNLDFAQERLEKIYKWMNDDYKQYKI
jgi:hypothetical protein